MTATTDQFNKHGSGSENNKDSNNKKGSNNFEQQPQVEADNNAFGIPDSIYGGLLALLGVWLTLNYTAKENKRSEYLEDMREIEKELNAYWKCTRELYENVEAETTDRTLRFYTATDQVEVKILQKTLVDISHHLQELERLKQRIEKYEEYIEKFTKHEKQVHQQIRSDLDLQQQKLKIAKNLQEILLARERKKFEKALVLAQDTIDLLNDYKEKNKSSNEIVTSTEKLLCTVYNHKAKTHRALAGHLLNALDMNQLVKSKESYEKALEFNPEDITLKVGLTYLDIDISESESDIQTRNALLENAKQRLEKDYLINKYDPNIHHAIAHACYQLEKCNDDAKKEVNKKSLEEALIKMEKVPPTARLYRDKALIFLLLGKEKEALKSYNEGFKKDNTHFLVLFERACLQMELRDYEAASQDLKRVKSIYDFDTNIVAVCNQKLEEINAKKNSFSFFKILPAVPLMAGIVWSQLSRPNR